MDKLIWFLTREGDWQEMTSCVIVALDEDSARQWAAASRGDEGEGPWYNPLESTCTRIGVADESTDFGLVNRHYLYV